MITQKIWGRKLRHPARCFNIRQGLNTLKLAELDARAAIQRVFTIRLLRENLTWLVDAAQSATRYA
jgi:hypothetical protein